ncbi:MAG: hypothetical protein OXU20_08285 [Myxococcales bacterium]|nr:hypothetical protein [Myxococcales bacterium]
MTLAQAGSMHRTQSLFSIPFTLILACSDGTSSTGSAEPAALRKPPTSPDDAGTPNPTVEPKNPDSGAGLPPPGTMRSPERMPAVPPAADKEDATAMDDMDAGLDMGSKDAGSQDMGSGGDGGTQTDAGGAVPSGSDAATESRDGGDPDVPAVQVGPHFDLPPLTTARLETLVSPEALPATENGAFLDDGRFFVAAAAGIYEIRAAGDGYEATLLVQSPGCVFGGLTSRGAKLYTPCTDLIALTGELMVLDPDREDPVVSRAPFETEAGAHYNGMAFGPDEALYLSNSLSANTPDPAVIRLVIVEEDPLRFTQTPFLQGGATQATSGGTFPNGIRFARDTMYFVRGADVVAVPLDPGQRTAELKVVYEADGAFPVIDDFELTDGRLWLTEFGVLRALGLPGQSQLVVTDLTGDVQFEMDLPFIGSSTIASAGPLFGSCILLTSYMNGGLYRVVFE